MITLKDLTPEIEAKIPEYIARALDGVSDGGRYENFNYDNAVAAVKWNYKKCDMECPTVLVAENPFEMQLMYNKYICELENLPKTVENLRKYNNSYLFTLNFYSDCYYSWYEFIRKEFNLELSINDEFQECFALQRASGVCQAIFGEKVCVVCKYPKRIYWDNNDLLHNTTGQAIEWGYTDETTKFDCYYIHGREMPDELFTVGFTKEDFLNQTNEDIRAGMFEIIESRGEGSMLEFLEAYTYNVEHINHLNGENETLTLYRTHNKFPELEDLTGKSNVPLCWLRLECPSTGTNYLISTDASFETASEAAKYHRPEEIPFELDYIWNSRN